MTPHRSWRAVFRCVVLLCGLASAGAWAHKSSDAYLMLDSDANGTTLRWDIALRDLDAALALDANDDGALSWGEVRAAWPRVDAYALPRLAIGGCALRLVDHALERRGDGAYAVLRLTSDCKLGANPKIDYGLFREIDPTHRGIAKLHIGDAPEAVRVLDPGATRVGATSGDADARADGRADGYAARGEFVREGVHHILTGYDHVLFLLCLLLPAVMKRGSTGGWEPVDRLSQAVLPIFGMVTAFTVAHSITLGLAATGVLALPSRLIEPAIAVTIVLAALDNVRRVLPLPRATMAFVFGLIHGFAFADVLSELQLAPAQFAWALLGFNVGIEAGQLLIVVVATAVLFLLRRRAQYRRWVVGAGSWAAMAIGTVWLIERTANVSWLPF